MQLHLIFYLTEVVGYVTALQQPTATRMFLWDHSFLGKRLTTSSLGVIGKTTKQRCVFTCGKIPECRSINFCGSHFCELKRENVDIMTTELLKTHLVSNFMCDHQGLAKNSTPECYEKGVVKDISDNDNPGSCQLNLKQLFHECIDWETVIVIDTADEFKEVRRQVDTGSCFVTSDEQILSWVKYVKEEKTRKDAISHCKSIHGLLFFDLDQDQTTGQLDMLFNKLDNRSNWIGMFKKENDAQWFNFRAEPIDITNFKWADGEPDEEGDAKALNRISENGVRMYLEDTNYSNERYYFACDLREY